MKNIDWQLEQYKEDQTDYKPREEKVRQAVRRAQTAFYENQRAQTASYPEFLLSQAAYIKKRWWFLQFFILAVLWGFLYFSGGGVYVQRITGIVASAFVIMFIPELWKNQSSVSLEIEGTTFFSIRQIYTARMLLFSIVDILLLSVFFLISFYGVQMTIGQAVIQFFLPLNITCCICFHVLCCKRLNSEYFALLLCMLFVVVWTQVVLRESVYGAISPPVWAGVVLASVCYLGISVYRVVRNCGNFERMDRVWN